MSDRDLVEQARDLMSRASSCFQTVQGGLHLTRDPEAARAAWERRKRFTKFPTHVVEVSITDEMRARLPRKFQVVVPDEAQGRLWVRHPWTVRVEGQIGWEQQPWAPVAYQIIQIHYKHHTWTWDLNRLKFKGKETSGGRPQGPIELFDPRRVLQYWSLSPLGLADVAGRPTIRLRAEPNPPDPELYFLDMLNHLSWVGHAADAWELDVDRERGIVLRLAAMVRGSAFMTVEFTTIELDQPIPDEVFTFADCEGADEEPPLWHQRHMPLPGGWDLFLPEDHPRGSR